MAEPLNGRICPLCASPLAAKDALVSCSACKTLHHDKCWRENRMCTTLDCRGTPRAVEVVTDTSVDVTKFNSQLDEIRGGLNKLTRRFKELGENIGDDEELTKAVSDITARIEADAIERRAEAARMQAALTDLLIRVRALDYSVARHRFPGEPERSTRSAPRAAKADGATS